MANGDSTGGPIEQQLADLAAQLTDLTNQLAECCAKIEQQDKQSAEQGRLLAEHDRKVALHDQAVAKHDEKVAQHDRVMADLIVFRQMYGEFLKVRYEMSTRESRFIGRELELTSGDNRTREQRQRTPRPD